MQTPAPGRLLSRRSIPNVKLFRLALVAITLALIPTIAWAQVYSPNGGLTTTDASGATGSATRGIDTSLKKNQLTETTAALGANGVYTGAWHDTTLDNTTYVRVFSEAAGGVQSATNGLQIQEVDDTANTGAAGAAFQIGTGAFGNAAVGGYINARYWRVVYTNGATAQTTLAIYDDTISGGTLPTSGAILPLASTAVPIISGGGNGGLAGVYSPTADGLSPGTQNALTTSSFPFALNPSGGYDRIRSYNGGIQKVALAVRLAVPIAVGATSNSVLTTSAGEVVGILVTASGTTAMTCYDNASAASGTVVAIVPATGTSVNNSYVGEIISVEMPLANGLTCGGGSGNPGVTVGIN